MKQSFSYTPISPRWSRDSRLAARRVMIIQSDEWLRDQMRPIVRSMNCEIFEVHTGLEALALLEAGFRGVVVLDSCLPDADGVTVYERIRKADPTLPVIFAAEDLIVRTGLERVRDDAFAYCEAGDIIVRLPQLLREALNAMNEAVGGSVRRETFGPQRALVAA